MDWSTILLELALTPDIVTAAARVKALPRPLAKQIALSLGLSTTPPRAALVTAIKWAQQYRSQHARYEKKCRTSFAATLQHTHATPIRGTVSNRNDFTPPAALAGAYDAAVHIVQHEAGSGVLVSHDTVLTCAHCVCADTDPDEEDSEGGEGDDSENDEVVIVEAPLQRVGRVKLLLFADGTLAVAKCVAADEARDLALLRIITRSGGSGKVHTGLRVGTVDDEKKRVPVVCVGNPSEFNLESTKEGAKIKFSPPVFHTSMGELAGRTSASVLARMAVGPWKHSAWTYWGHSGAPLIDKNGCILGLHNSWNPEDGHRHCVGPDGIAAFLASASALMGVTGAAASGATTAAVAAPPAVAPDAGNANTIGNKATSERPQKRLRKD